jgi:hypothetical protein
MLDLRRWPGLVLIALVLLSLASNVVLWAIIIWIAKQFR